MDCCLREDLSTDNLRKQGIIVIDWCYMCKMSGELVFNFLLHCPIVYELWTMVWSLVGLIWVMLQRVIDLLAAWQGPFG